MCVCVWFIKKNIYIYFNHRPYNNVFLFVQYNYFLLLWTTIIMFLLFVQYLFQPLALFIYCFCLGSINKSNLYLHEPYNNIFFNIYCFYLIKSVNHYWRVKFKCVSLHILIIGEGDLIPVMGFFCQRCEEFFGDLKSAERHVESHGRKDRNKVTL